MAGAYPASLDISDSWDKRVGAITSLEVGTWGTELKWLLKVTHKAWWMNGGHAFPSPKDLDQILPFWGKQASLSSLLLEL